MKRILVVDDDPQFLEMVVEMLEGAGYGITAAASGKKALELFGDEEWDLVICDLIMPEPDGIETILAMRRRVRDQKFLALSGGGRYLKPEEVLKVAEALGAQVLGKPISQHHFLETVAELVT